MITKYCCVTALLLVQYFKNFPYSHSVSVIQLVATMYSTLVVDSLTTNYFFKDQYIAPDPR